MFNLGEKLKQARIEAGLDQKDVAPVLDLDQGKISLIEKGARKVDAEKELPKFAKLYKKPISWFYEDINEIPQEQSEVDAFLCRYLPDVNFSEFEKKRLSEFLGNVAKSYVETKSDLHKKAN